MKYPLLTNLHSFISVFNSNPTHQKFTVDFFHQDEEEKIGCIVVGLYNRPYDEFEDTEIELFSMNSALKNLMELKYWLDEINRYNPESLSKSRMQKDFLILTDISEILFIDYRKNEDYPDNSFFFKYNDANFSTFLQYLNSEKPEWLI